MRAGIAAFGLLAALSAAAEGLVPPARHGLWACVPADCARGEALLTLISAHGLGEAGTGDLAIAAAAREARDGTLR